LFGSSTGKSSGGGFSFRRASAFDLASSGKPSAGGGLGGGFSFTEANAFGKAGESSDGGGSGAHGSGFSFSKATGFSLSAPAGAPGIMRAPLISAPLALFGSDPARPQAMQAQNYLSAVYEENYGQVQAALQVVQKYKEEAAAGAVTDPVKYNEALLVLHNAKDTWLIAAANMTALNQKVLQEKSGAQEMNPESIGTQEGRVPQNPGSLPPPAQMREQVEAGRRDVQMQIDIHSVLVSEDVAKSAQAALNDVLLNLTIADTPEGLAKILQQLSAVQQMLA
jgi:hypothetical protein